MKKRGIKLEPCKATTQSEWYLGSPKQWKTTIQTAATPRRPIWACMSGSGGGGGGLCTTGLTSTMSSFGLPPLVLLLFTPSIPSDSMEEAAAHIVVIWVSCAAPDVCLLPVDGVGVGGEIVSWGCRCLAYFFALVV